MMTNETHAPFQKKNLWKYLLPLGLLAYIYYPTFVWMMDRWSARDSYYGHGFLVPLVSLYWIFKKRSNIQEQTDSRRLPALGVTFLAAAAGIQIISSFLRIYFLSAFSLVFLLIGGIDLLFGRKTLRSLWFPVAFLTMMIPLPLLVISQITLQMKFFVSEISTYLINATGIEAVRQGSYIYTRNSVLLVGDPCSGLRSFLAFLCLGFVFAYESRMEIWKKVLLVAVGLPLALLSNIFRVFFLGMVGEIYGMEYTAGFLHDFSGIAVFVFAFLAFILIRQKLEMIRA